MTKRISHRIFWPRILLIAAISVSTMVATHEAANASCPLGQYYNVPVQDPSCASCCTGSLPKQGCKAYECSSGQLSSGWGTATSCPPYPTSSSSCGSPSSECYELCENATDDDGDGIADEGCVGNDTCTSPGGCQARNDTSPSRGTAHLAEPADWSIPGVGPLLAFRRVYQSGWYRPLHQPGFEQHGARPRLVAQLHGARGRDVGFASAGGDRDGDGRPRDRLQLDDEHRLRLG